MSSGPVRGPRGLTKRDHFGTFWGTPILAARAGPRGSERWWGGLRPHWRVPIRVQIDSRPAWMDINAHPNGQPPTRSGAPPLSPLAAPRRPPGTD